MIKDSSNSWNIALYTHPVKITYGYRILGCETSFTSTFGKGQYRIWSGTQSGFWIHNSMMTGIANVEFTIFVIGA